MFESSLRGTRADDDLRAWGSLAGVAVPDGAPGVFTAPSAVLARLDEVAGSLAQVSAAADGCAGWTGAQRVAVLAGIDRLVAVLTTTRARWLLAERDAGTSVRTGAPDYTAAVARRTRG